MTATPRTDALTARMAGELDRPLLQADHMIEVCGHARMLEREVAALTARLEINPEAPGYDGIACRDETIKLLDAKVAQLEVSLSEGSSELAVARGAAVKANRTVERMRGLLQETKKAMLGYPMSTRALSSSALLAGINDVLREGEKE